MSARPDMLIKGEAGAQAIHIYLDFSSRESKNRKLRALIDNQPIQTNPYQKTHDHETIYLSTEHFDVPGRFRGRGKQ
jgi:hypothetical protein